MNKKDNWFWFLLGLVIFEVLFIGYKLATEDYNESTLQQKLQWHKDVQ